MPKFKVGQLVTVTGQNPPADGVVEKVSTIDEILGYSTGTDLGAMYWITSTQWVLGSWIAEGQLVAKDEH
jgi:hypothetical protein